jgi:hypothetical protein
LNILRNVLQRTHLPQRIYFQQRKYHSEGRQGPHPVLLQVARDWTLQQRSQRFEHASVVLYAQLRRSAYDKAFATYI